MRGKPEGWDIPIPDPLSKTEELLELLDGYRTRRYTETGPDGWILEEDGVLLEIVNPFREENLFLALESSFTLFFGGWHAHYFLYEWDYQLMKRDLLSLLDGTSGVLAAEVEGKWMSAALLPAEQLRAAKAEDLLKQLHLPEEHLERIRERGAVFWLETWKSRNRREVPAKRPVDARLLQNGKQEG